LIKENNLRASAPLFLDAIFMTFSTFVTTNHISSFSCKICPAIAVEIFSTTESSTTVLTVAILLCSATILSVPLPALMVCLCPEPLPFPSKMENPPTMSLSASKTAQS